MALDIAVAVFSAGAFTAFITPAAVWTVVDSVYFDFFTCLQFKSSESADWLNVFDGNGLDIVLAYVHSLLTQISISHLTGPRTGNAISEAATTVLTKSSWISRAYK